MSHHHRRSQKNTPAMIKSCHYYQIGEKNDFNEVMLMKMTKSRVWKVKRMNHLTIRAQVASTNMPSITSMTSMINAISVTNITSITSVTRNTKTSELIMHVTGDRKYEKYDIDKYK